MWISDPERAALETVDRDGIEADVSTIKIDGKYGSGVYTLEELLDRADDVLQGATGRS